VGAMIKNEEEEEGEKIELLEKNGFENEETDDGR